MNFFKSILYDVPVPVNEENSHGSDHDSPRNAFQDGGATASGKDFGQKSLNHSSSTPDSDASGEWTFGGLIKTFAARSESMIETYRRDLKEFGSGLKSETDILREVASKVVKDLPASLEAGAHVLDGVIKSTAEIISKENLVLASKGGSKTPETNKGLNSGRYSWFESQLNVIQSDYNTYCQEPDDADEYKEWKLGFNLDDKRVETEKLLMDNGIFGSVYNRVVPITVDHQTFWCRYFYRLDKLKHQDRVRANLMKRGNSADLEEDLSWDVDEDDNSNKGSEENNAVEAQDGSEKIEKVQQGERALPPIAGLEDSKSRLQDEVEACESNADKGDDKNKVSALEKVQTSFDIAVVKNQQGMAAEVIGEEQSNEKTVKLNEKLNTENDKGKKHESVKKNDVAAKEEDDMGWDEIEDVGSGDEKNTLNNLSGNENRTDLRKQLSVAEDDDEDLSWDIEDDDEPLKTLIAHP